MAKEKNLIWHQSHISRVEKEYLLGQKSMTIWLTGLSASGKSTLAFATEKELYRLGRACHVLDGDNIRHGLNKSLGFSDIDRAENIRRIAEVARLMNDAGLIVITAFISPSRIHRESARNIIGNDYFKEVYVSTPLTTCELRDPKGLYKKARLGYVAKFTGISDDYEAPLAPELILDTSTLSLEQGVRKLVNLII